MSTNSDWTPVATIGVGDKTSLNVNVNGSGDTRRVGVRLMVTTKKGTFPTRKGFVVNREQTANLATMLAGVKAPRKAGWRTVGDVSVTEGDTTVLRVSVNENGVTGIVAWRNVGGYHGPVKGTNIVLTPEVRESLVAVLDATL